MDIQRLSQVLAESFDPIQINDWTVDFKVDTHIVYPTLPNGETIRVTVWTIFIILRNSKNDTVVFKLTKKGNHYDSREPNKVIAKSDVISELDRMLGPGMGNMIYKRAEREVSLASGSDGGRDIWDRVAKTTGSPRVRTSDMPTRKSKPAAPPPEPIDPNHELLAGLE